MYGGCCSHESGDIMIRLTFFLVMVLGALLFGASAVVQADARGYDHSHVYAFILDKHTVYVYNCVATVQQLPSVDTWTDGVNTMYVINGRCGEA